MQLWVGELRFCATFQLSPSLPTGAAGRGPQPRGRRGGGAGASAGAAAVGCSVRCTVGPERGHGGLQAAGAGLCQPCPPGEWGTSLGPGQQGSCRMDSVAVAWPGAPGWEGGGTNPGGSVRAGEEAGEAGGCWQGLQGLVQALSTSSSSVQETWYWAGSPDATRVVMSGVRCAGTELALQQCQRHGPVHCPSGGGRFSAGVTCTARE